GESCARWYLANAHRREAELLLKAKGIALNIGEAPSSAQAVSSRQGTAATAKDWPRYNCDVLGWGHNAGETTLSRATVGAMEEQWRFPRKGADFRVGASHGTPTVVGGYVFFGTVNKAAFYKLTPDGKMMWSFRLTMRDDRFIGLFNNGIYSSALVTEDAVYF